MLRINFKPKTVSIIGSIAKNLFFGLLFLLIVFTILEAVKPRIVLNFINLDLFLFVTLALGIITIFYYQPPVKEIKKLKFLDYSAVVLFSTFLGLTAIYFTRQIGYLAILVGLAGAIISYYIIILCCKE